MLDRIYISEADIQTVLTYADDMYRFSDCVTVSCLHSCSRCPVHRYKTAIPRDTESYPVHTHCAQIVEVLCDEIDALDQQFITMDKYLLTQEDV